MEIDANGIAIKLPLDALRGLVREVVSELLASVAADGTLAYTEAQAAKLLNVPRHSLREARVLGRIHPVKVGKRWLYSRAMLALRRFLSPRRCPFELNDFTLCHWPMIDAIGQSWIDARAADELVELDIGPWLGVLPTLDLWLHVESGEMHHVRDLIPTLDWEGGRLGVRLRYEPGDLSELYKDFMRAVAEAAELRAAATADHAKRNENVDPPAPQPKLTLWPSSLCS